MLHPRILDLRNRQWRFMRDYETNKLRQWHANLAALEMLDASGVVGKGTYNKPSGGYASGSHWIEHGIDLKVEAADLPALRKAFGVCKDAGAYEIVKAEEQLVRVALDLGLPECCRVKLHYVRTLPPDSKCRIVEEITTVFGPLKRHSLVCDAKQVEELEASLAPVEESI